MYLFDTEFLFEATLTSVTMKDLSVCYLLDFKAETYDKHYENSFHRKETGH